MAMEIIYGDQKGLWEYNLDAISIFPTPNPKFLHLQCQTTANSYGWLGVSRGLRLRWVPSTENWEVLSPSGLAKCLKNNVNGQEWWWKAENPGKGRAIRAKVNTGPVRLCWIFLPHEAGAKLNRDWVLSCSAGAVWEAWRGGVSCRCLTECWRLLWFGLHALRFLHLLPPVGCPPFGTHKPPYPET